MLKEKSRLLEGQSANMKNERQGKDTIFSEPEHRFLLFENCPDLMPILRDLQNIAISRENPKIRESLLKGLRALVYAIGQQQQQISGLYTDIAALQRKIAKLQAIVTEYANHSGIHPFEMIEWLRTLELSQKAISDVQKTIGGGDGTLE